MLCFYDVRHLCIESAGFELERPHGYPSHTFLHFVNPVEISVNGEIIKTEPNACIIYKADTPQKFYSPTKLSNSYIHFSSSDPEDILEKYGLQYNTIYYPLSPSAISVIIHEIEQIFFHDNYLRSELLDVKVRELFIKLSQSVSSKTLPPVDDDTKGQFVTLRSFVMTQLDQQWTVRQMADMANLCPSRFHSLYKVLFGCSPTADLIRARIERAKNLLLFSKDSISTIASNLGYNSVPHFTRQFKSATGSSPSEFRGNYRKQDFPLPIFDEPSPSFSISTDVLTYHTEVRKHYPEIRRIIQK